MGGYDRRTVLKAGMVLGVSAVAGCLGDDGHDRFEVETVADGLAHPWGLAFEPDGSRLLVTERDSGTVAVVDLEDETVERIDGTPEVDTGGQGGLLDVALHPAYLDEPWVYLTYSAANADGETTTHLGRARLEGGRLEGFEELFAAEPFVDSTAHYGSRVVFGEDGMAYVTVGDRQSKAFGPDHYSQDRTNELGTTLRLTPEGAPPEDNPFVDEPNVRDAIYSYGHRNVQGMTVHPGTGEIWQSEHGERDGDELNVLERGGNYGWPVAHYGCEYGTEEPVGDEPGERDDVVDPVYYWECASGGFPPAGMTFYDGDAVPEWQGDLFVGNLAGEYLGRFAVDGTDVTELEPLLADQGWRIRDVEVAPETGELYVAVDDADAPVVRLVPS